MIIDEAYIRENLLSQTDSNGADLKLIANNKTAQKAFNKIERLIRVRDRAVSEVEARLIQDEYPQEAINEAIERALMCGYLDDLRFTEVFIRTRIEAGKGLSGIIRDLKRLQIDPYTLEGFPYQYLPENYEAIDSALNVLLKKPPRAKNKSQAAYAKLIREGYASSDASEAVQRWVNLAHETHSCC
ncbi:uncharacterized BCR [Eggerthella sp. CAG:368]|nr:uncharacterized BCR [Eggerthella sp. CAG:368]